MINSNLPPILHRFRDIASQSVQNRYIFSNTFWFNPPTEGLPWDDLRKILPGCRHVTNVLHGVETLPKISIGWVGCTNVTDKRQTNDRQTDRRHTDDRQTDGRRHIANMNMSSRSLKTDEIVRRAVPKCKSWLRCWQNAEVGSYCVHNAVHVTFLTLTPSLNVLPAPPYETKYSTL